MSKLVRFFVASSAPRYLILVAAVLLTELVSWITFLRSDAESFLDGATGWVGALACLIWIVFAVFERRRLRWRLLLVWAPEIIPVTMMFGIIIPGDDTGLGSLLGIMLIMVMAVPCVIGTIAALVYRPGERPLPPTE